MENHFAVRYGFNFGNGQVSTMDVGRRHHDVARRVHVRHRTVMLRQIRQGKYQRYRRDLKTVNQDCTCDTCQAGPEAPTVTVTEEMFVKRYNPSSIRRYSHVEPPGGCRGGL
jgi:hypothetical protein